MEFIYNGDVSVRLDHLDDFLLVAQRLKIKGLITEDVEDVGTKIQEVASGLKYIFCFFHQLIDHFIKRKYCIRRLLQHSAER